MYSRRCERARSPPRARPSVSFTYFGFAFSHAFCRIRTLLCFGYALRILRFTVLASRLTFLLGVPRAPAGPFVYP